jgi:hypothetical protein
MAPNVFSCLFRYGCGVDENYLTESLVFLVRLLLERMPEEGLALVNLLSGDSQGALFSNPHSLEISTQITVEQGRPDIDIRDGSEVLVYVEVKHDSGLGWDQLERYRAQLRASGIPTTRLVLLTRSRYSSLATTLSPSEYYHLRWYEIYNRLSAIETPNDVCEHFIRCLMDFLEEKKMSMKQVRWEYITGVPALLSLTDMMEAAIAVVMPDSGLKRTAGWSWRGFYLYEEYFFGMRYAEPLTVVFEDNRGNSPNFKQSLDLADVHFFSLSKDEQFERIVAFLQGAAERLTRVT